MCKNMNPKANICAKFQNYGLFFLTRNQFRCIFFELILVVRKEMTTTVFVARFVYMNYGAYSQRPMNVYIQNNSIINGYASNDMDFFSPPFRKIFAGAHKRRACTYIIIILNGSRISKIQIRPILFLGGKKNIINIYI